MVRADNNKKILSLLAAFALGMLVMFVISYLASLPSRNQGKAAGAIAPVSASAMPTAMPAEHIEVSDLTPAPAPTIAGATEVAGTLTPQQIADKAKPSVVYIETQSMSGDARAQGSGFCVAPGTVVTNYHVVENARSIGVRLVASQTGLDTAVLLKADAEHDLALLRVPRLDAPALQLQPTSPGVGDTIYTMSNPRGLEGTFTEGNVSAFRKTEKSNDPLMQITAPISPGSSGGPVFDRYGKVVGVVVATWKDAQNINFAVLAKHIHALLSAPASIRPESPDVSASQQHVTLTAQELYYKGLEELDAGNKSGALEVWNELSHLDKGLADRLFDAYHKSFKEP
jgi:S1-C subfamily serine protease